MISKVATKVMVPLCVQINKYNHIVGLKIPSFFQNKTIYEILSENVNYHFYMDKKYIEKLTKKSKRNDIFLL